MTVIYEKNAVTTQRPGATVKLMNALVFRDWVPTASLDTVVSVTAEDTVNWSNSSNAQLLSGDMLSYRDLLYGMLLPSGSDAARCIARNVGALIIAGGGPGTSDDPMTRYIQAMNAKATAIGLPTAVYADAYGIDQGNLMSATDLASLMVKFADDPFLVSVGGTLSRTLTVAGVNARTYTVSHTINPNGSVLLPEFIAGKTGSVTYSDTSLNTGICVAILWQSPSGKKRVTTILGAAANPAYYQDLRKLIDYELARLGEL